MHTLRQTYSKKFASEVFETERDFLKNVNFMIFEDALTLAPEKIITNVTNGDVTKTQQFKSFLISALNLNETLVPDLRTLVKTYQSRYTGLETRLPGSTISPPNANAKAKQAESEAERQDAEKKPFGVRRRIFLPRVASLNGFTENETKTLFALSKINLIF